MSEMKLGVTPVFTKNYHTTKKIVVNRGGTRSSKTRSIAQISLLWLLTGRVTNSLNIPVGVWTTTRKFRTTLDATVIRDFEEEIELQDVRGLLKINLTKKTYEYGQRLVEFIGADDEQKLRGAKRNILYCNEANELDYRKEFFQLLMRTEDKIFLDFNPDDENIWINTELEQRRAVEKGDVDVIVSTYKDNTYLPQSLINEIEYLEKTDPEFWKIYGLGEYGKVYGVIFDEPNVVPEIPKEANLQGYGMDFGYTHDPTTLIGVWLMNGELYIDELIYDRGLTNPQIAQRMRDVGLTQQDTIIADSAEPKSIQEIYNEGFDIRPAEKGKDSIVNGIDILKRYKWNVTSRSQNLLKERRSYKWQEDKTGTQTRKPVDFNNHALDALRYLGLSKLGKTNSGLYFLH
jgi:phage terminase large subunit